MPRLRPDVHLHHWRPGVLCQPRPQPKTGGHGAREMFSATCASCGKRPRCRSCPAAIGLSIARLLQQRGGSSRRRPSGGRGRDWPPRATAARSLDRAAESRLLRTRDCSTLAGHGHAIVRLGALRARAAAALGVRPTAHRSSSRRLTYLREYHDAERELAGPSVPLRW